MKDTIILNAKTKKETHGCYIFIQSLFDDWESWSFYLIPTIAIYFSNFKYLKTTSLSFVFDWLIFSIELSFWIDRDKISEETK